MSSDKIACNKFASINLLKIKGENMGNNKSKILAFFAALLMIVALAETDYAQRRARIRGYTQQQVEQLLERIEERSDFFSTQLNKSLDRSRLDGSRRENNITERARELENATDELRREFDHNDSRGENKPEAEKILITATTVDRLMKSRNFGGQTESTWAALLTEINLLAKLYGLAAVGSRNYR